MDIKRGGSQPSGKGPAEYFTGDRPHRPFVSGERTGSCDRRERHIRAPWHERRGIPIRSVRP